MRRPNAAFFDFLRELIVAGADGIPAQRAYALAGGIVSLNQGAQWARSFGLPLVASRAGGDSRWWLIKADDVRYEEWVTRILSDVYAETVRAHRALKPHPDQAARVKKLQSAAVAIGAELGIDLSEIVEDLKPLSLGPGAESALIAAGYLPAPVAAAV